MIQTNPSTSSLGSVKTLDDKPGLAKIQMQTDVMPYMDRGKRTTMGHY